MRLVVDSSVIVGVCLAGGTLGPLEGHEIQVPAHLAAEVTSALREQAFRGVIPADKAAEAIGYLSGIQMSFDTPGAHATAAFELASQLGWAKTYDAEYVVLAQALEVPLVTVDGRLRRGAGQLATIIGPAELPEPSR